MKYDLVFEGGGAKGMVFVGALQEFTTRGHTYDRLLGTSAGAITAALLAAGYTSQELLDVLSEREDNQSVFVGFLATPPGFTQKDIENSVTYEFLHDVDVPLIPDFVEDRFDYLLIDALMKQPGYRNMFSFVERGGWFSAHKFVSWLERKLDAGTFKGQPRNFSRMTLGEFFATTGTELSMVATDTTGGQMLVLNHITAPDCPVVWAVRMSMSIPLLWPEVEWRADWGSYRNKTVAGHLIVDGGLLSNFPLELFVSDRPEVVAVMGPKKSENILGLLIDESLPVDDGVKPAIFDPSRVDLQKSRVAQRISRLINTTIQANDKMVIQEFEHYVVRLPAGGYGTTEFDMTDERREKLVAAGRKTMAQYFDTAAPGLRIAALEDVETKAATDYADRIAIKILNGR